MKTGAVEGVLQGGVNEFVPVISVFLERFWRETV